MSSRPKLLPVMIPAAAEFPMRLYVNAAGDAIDPQDSEFSNALESSMLISEDGLSKYQLIPQAQQFAPQLIYWLLHNQRFGKAYALLQNPANGHAVHNEWVTRAVNELIRHKRQSDNLSAVRRLIGLGVRPNEETFKLTRGFAGKLKLLKNRLINPITSAIRSAWRRFKSIFSRRKRE
jgi:hypothetical protein